MQASVFGWADDSAAPIDTTPVNLSLPPEPLVAAAALLIPEILANVDPAQNHGEVSIVASALIEAMVKRGYTRHASCWAVHRLVVSGKLLAKPAYTRIPIKLSLRQAARRGLGPHLVEGWSRREVPEGRPAPVDCFRVVATDALWAWWRGNQAGNAEPVATKPKRSSERGEGRVKLIAALTDHHGYARGGCLNTAPIGSNELARKAQVSEATASRFFAKEFGGHAKYRRACRERWSLVKSLKCLNSEFSPVDLYGAAPPGEGGWDDES